MSPAHVLALRLYTTFAFKYFNGPLRDVATYGHEKLPHPFPLTVMFIAEGIKKLRAVHVVGETENATMSTSLWRGMKNMQVSDDFMRNNRGGTGVQGFPIQHRLHAEMVAAHARAHGRIRPHA